MINYLEELSNWSLDADGDRNGDDDDEEFISAGDVDGSNVWYCCHCGEPVHKDEAIADHYTDDIYCSEACFYAAGGNIDPDGDDDDDDEEFISAGDVDGTETLYCCQCGEPMDADEAIPDSYTDDIYCCQSCYLAAGGNIDPDGDDDGDNLCDYCLEEIVTPVYDADGHEYCCEECMQKALEENANDVEDDED